MWIFKHAPKTVGEVAGNDDARSEVKTWALEWNRGKAGKPLLLAGPTGSGKTALCNALAAEMGWLVVEATPSDVRGKEELQKLFSVTAGSSGLFGEKRLLLVEDVDTAFDKGEVPELLRIVKDARQPIIFTANNAWEQKISALRSNCKPVDFKSINPRTVARVLSNIVGREGVAKSTADVESIAANSKGDLRSAIIDLEFSSAGYRERRTDVFRTVAKIFKAEKFEEALYASNEADVDLDLLYRWMEENVPAEYEEKQEIADSFNALSRADVFKGRIMRRQHWGFLKYYRALATAGVALSKREKHFKFTRYAFPSIIRMLSSSRNARGMKKKVGVKAGKLLHCSSRDAVETIAMIMPPISFAQTIELDEDETEYFKENLARKKKKA